MTPELEEYQAFYTNWYGDSKPGEFKDKFPYELPLGTLPFRPCTTCENKILVTESYETLYRRILSLRMEDDGHKRGVVVTGQPGTGESPSPDHVLVRHLTGASVPQGKQPS